MASLLALFTFGQSIGMARSCWFSLYGPLYTFCFLVHHITDYSAVKHNGHCRLIENQLNAHTERQEHPQEVKFIMDFLVQHDFVVVSPRMTETHYLNSLPCLCGFPHIRNCR